MKINILNESENRMEFELIDASIAIANAIRRTLLSDIPHIAIDDIIIYKNTTIMNDEIIGHRISLVPLIYTGNINEIENTKVTIQKTFNIDTIETLYDKDFIFESKDCKIMCGTIPIVKGWNEQEIHLEGIIRKGCHHEHSKWAVCTVCFMKHVTKDEKRIVMEFETVGSISCKELLKKAIEIVIEKVERMDQYKVENNESN